MIFVKFNRFGGLNTCRYDGMETVTVARLLSDLGATGIEFIDEATYLSLQPVHE